MTVTKFYSENETERYLEVMQSEGKLISIYIDNDDEDECICVDITIKDAERLMDEIHKLIIKAEGGKNE